MSQESLSGRARPFRAAVAAVAATALAVGGALGLAAPALAGTAPTTVHTTFESGRYIVALAEEPVATYTGGVAGYAATRPDAGDQLSLRAAPVENYAEYLGQRQLDVAGDAGVAIDASYTLTVNGFAADLTADQARTLAADRRVATLVPDEILHPTAAEPSTDFLGLSGDDGVWAGLGGTDQAGKGVVVGVIDTGIAPENPSFAGGAFGSETDGPTQAADGAISYAKADGGTFTGVCQAGEAGQQFDGSECNTKVIGARYFVDGFGVANLGVGAPGVAEYVSPRDGDGHGSHTASTAAGETGVEASVVGQDFGAISGVAPAAKIAAYKVCWSGPDPDDTADDGCASSDILAAIEAATTDGVDVINFSIGGGAAATTVSLTDQAFLGAAAAGIFVSASAGNSGPGASTLDNASPWITTVAASTIPSYEAEAVFSTGLTVAGASITVPAEPVTAPVVTATAAAAAGATDPNLCLPGTLDPALVDGRIVVCERGVNARAQKSEVVAEAGGVGVVLVNVTPSSLDLDEHAVPTVHVDAAAHDAVIASTSDAVIAAASEVDATVTLRQGNTTGTTPPVPQVAGFSSRGPVLADGSDVLKPDIAAPGVGILAAANNAEDEDPTWEFLSGTSMAAPHVAGLAALYLGAHPEAPVSEVKSAMMTTASDTVGADGAPVTDPFAQGAGQVEPADFLSPGLVYLAGVPEWLGYIEGVGIDTGSGVAPIDPSQLNQPSIAIGSLTAPETITRTVTALEAGSYTASVAGLAGVDVTVSPATFDIAAGATQELQITFSRTDAALDAWATGSLSLTEAGGGVVRSPIAVQPVTLVAPGDAAGTGTAGAVDVTVTPGGSGPIPLTTTGLAKGELLKDPAAPDAEHSGTGTQKGQYVDYEVVVPEGAAFARFDLDSLDDTADLDLLVVRLDDTGTPVEQWSSGTAAADERVDIAEPTAGTYIAEVSVFSVPGPTDWDLVATTIVPGATAPLALTPETLEGVQGQPATYTASWEGLDAFSHYVGLVSYADTGRSTAISVTTGDVVEPGAPVNTALPTITGTPDVGQKLTASPGTWDPADVTFAYQWQRDGADIPGATASTYKVAKKDAGAALTVVVTATTAEGVSATAASEPVTVRFASTTSLSVKPQVTVSWQRSTATVTVKSGAPTAPTGTVTLTIDGKKVEVPTTLADGKVTYQLPKLPRGVHSVRASYGGDDVSGASTSKVQLIWVVF